MTEDTSERLLVVTQTPPSRCGGRRRPRPSTAPAAKRAPAPARRGRSRGAGRRGSGTARRAGRLAAEDAADRDATVSAANGLPRRNDVTTRRNAGERDRERQLPPARRRHRHRRDEREQAGDARERLPAVVAGDAVAGDEQGRGAEQEAADERVRGGRRGRHGRRQPRQIPGERLVRRHHRAPEPRLERPDDRAGTQARAGDEEGLSARGARRARRPPRSGSRRDAVHVRIAVELEARAGDHLDPVIGEPALDQPARAVEVRREQRDARTPSSWSIRTAASTGVCPGTPGRPAAMRSRPSRRRRRPVLECTRTRSRRAGRRGRAAGRRPQLRAEPGEGLGCRDERHRHAGHVGEVPGRQERLDVVGARAVHPGEADQAERHGQVVVEAGRRGQSTVSGATREGYPARGRAAVRQVMVPSDAAWHDAPVRTVTATTHHEDSFETRRERLVAEHVLRARCRPEPRRGSLTTVRPTSTPRRPRCAACSTTRRSAEPSASRRAVRSRADRSGVR